MTIKISRKAIQQFHKKAKENFPNETFGFFLGTKTSERMDIKDFFAPTGVEQFCTKNSVTVQPMWIKEAKKFAKANNLEIISDGHSHPYNKKQVKLYNADTSPSEQDWNSLEKNQLMAICLIKESTDGKLRARTRFWGQIHQIKIKQT